MRKPPTYEQVMGASLTPDETGYHEPVTVETPALWRRDRSPLSWLIDALLILAIVAGACGALYLALNPGDAQAATDPVGATRSIMQDELNDYERTRFRRVTVRYWSDGKPAVCGELNGPNPYGGMTGWQPFMVDPESRATLFGHTAAARLAIGRLCAAPETVARDPTDVAARIQHR